MQWSVPSRSLHFVINMTLPRSSRLLGLLAPFALFAAASCTQAGDDAPIGSSSAPIIGGSTDTTDTFVVGVDIGGSSICSGTVISPSLVLTARHCVSKTPELLDCTVSNNIVSNYAASSFRVTTNQSLFAGGGASWTVRAVHYLNDATCTGGSTAPECKLCGYDLALLELNKGGAFPTKQVPPSLVPPLRKNYRAIGYGCQDAPTAVGGGCSTVGYRMFMDIAQVTSVAPLEFEINGRVCGGDSGGPVYDVAQNWIYGALSRGDGPTAGAPGCTVGIYTRTDAYSDWLQAQGAAAATRGGYAAPAWVTAVKPPPAVDAGVDSGPPPTKGALGATCAGPADCTSNICVSTGSSQVCSQKCGAPNPCPSGYDCVSNYCIPSDPPPPPPADTGVPVADPDTGTPPIDDDAGTGDPGVADSTSSKGGCAIAHDGPPPRPQPWIALSGLAVGAVLLGRRRRR